MATKGVDTAVMCRRICEDARKGIFVPVYLLMGEEPFYPDIACQTIIENCVDDSFKDFNETICFGADVTVDQIITTARRFPMMADRQLVVVKEAQMLKDIESLSVYCSEPMDSTVLVILMHGVNADKRKALYKSISKNGIVLESPLIRDYEIAGWISSYFAGRGLNISPEASVLLGESAGTSLSTIATETEKLVRNLPEGTTDISVEDIEKNVGVSRQFSIFELTKELSYRNNSKALKIAAHIGSAAKFFFPMAVSALFIYFYRILKYAALLSENSYPSPQEKAEALAGVNPYFYREYDVAVRNFPMGKTMEIISLLGRYDYLGKGGDGEQTPHDQLLMELVSKILAV